VLWACTGIFKQLKPEQQPISEILTYGMISGHRIKASQFDSTTYFKKILLILLNTAPRAGRTRVYVEARDWNVYFYLTNCIMNVSLIIARYLIVRDVTKLTQTVAVEAA
jgi:hypothetical protein